MVQLPLDLDTYTEKHTSAESAILQELNRQTHLQMLMPRMLSGHLQGKVLQMIVRMLRPMYVLELGTFTGYSAISMAEVLPAGAHLHTIEKNDELQQFIKQYIAKAGLEERITLHIGNAVDIIPGLDFPWDLIFLDADKPNYPNYFQLLAPKLKKGAWIVADNVLWGGKVVDNPDTFDEYTEGITSYNKLIQDSPYFENVMLPIRDGLLVAQKI
jgi:predicted O-methyltransferase YrrM